MAKTVRVFSTKWCPWCDRVKQFLKEHKIKFEELDVSEDPEAAQEMIEKTGQMGVPVIEIDDQIVIGYDERRLRELLNLR